MTRFTTPAATLLLVSCALLLVGCEKQTGAFAAPNLDDAKQQASDDDRYVLIDFTATWCAPCKKMDADTWSDSRVVEWIDEHAVAVQIDVDQKPDISRQYNVSAMPTIVLERDGTVVDRIVGYRGPDDFIRWLENARQGRTALETMRASVGDRPAPGEQADMQQRYMLASQLMRSGKLDEATEEFIWLWENMLEYQPSMYGVRMSFMVSDIEQLITLHPPAKTAFTELRDQLTPPVRNGTADRDQVVDWGHLSRMIGDADALVQWFDDSMSRPERRADLQLLDDDLIEILADRNRLADAIALYPDPVQQAKQTIMQTKTTIAHMGQAPEGINRNDIVKTMHGIRNQAVARLYAICLAADCDDEATEIAGILMDLEDNNGVALSLVEQAMRVGELRTHQIEWLEQLPPGQLRDHMLQELNQQLAAETSAE